MILKPFETRGPATLKPAPAKPKGKKEKHAK